MELKKRGRAPPAFDKWTNGDKEKLLEAHSDIVDIAHTALSQLEALKKKELLLSAMMMPDDEFEKMEPLLCIDLWEHAYYLKYQNNREKYITSWFKVINWEFVSKRYEGLK